VSSGDQLGLGFQTVTRRVWTVQDLVSAVRSQLEREYTDVWVEGEISNFRPAESGHLYFTLKENGAQIRVVMFRMQARLLRFRPENGLQVVARGRVTVYEARGELQISAEYLEPKGAGALQVAFEQLKAKLAAEGLFDTSRKKPIPALPRRIGLVTSPRGAALQDMLNILRRRHENVHILIYPAQVQGEAAAGEVSAGIRFFNRAASNLPEKKPVDVIIVARGGGSIEDLAAFNDEALARVVAESKVPVISAVGHETDFTILDFVADLRAPTPSAAAELVIRSKHELDERLTSMGNRMSKAIRYYLLMARQALTERAQHAALVGMREALNRRQQRLDEAIYQIGDIQRGILQQYRRRLDLGATRIQHHDLRRRVAALRREMDARAVALANATRRVLQDRRTWVQHRAARLDALSPLKVLERGYALVFDGAGNLVKDAVQVGVGEEIRARVARGEISAVVKQSKK
jgi:exodeoxyribonuclease VII large subunit